MLTTSLNIQNILTLATRHYGAYDMANNMPFLSCFVRSPWTGSNYRYCGRSKKNITSVVIAVKNPTLENWIELIKNEKVAKSATIPIIIWVIYSEKLLL